jgi:hypothetical protein
MSVCVCVCAIVLEVVIVCLHCFMPLNPSFLPVDVGLTACHTGLCSILWRCRSHARQTAPRDHAWFYPTLMFLSLYDKLPTDCSWVPSAGFPASLSAVT